MSKTLPKTYATRGARISHIVMVLYIIKSARVSIVFYNVFGNVFDNDWRNLSKMSPKSHYYLAIRA
jgi:hypothetical protein